MNVEIEENNTVNKTQIEFDYSIKNENCTDDLTTKTAIRDNAHRNGYTNSYNCFSIGNPNRVPKDPRYVVETQLVNHEKAYLK